MEISLDKKDLISLVMGTSPYYSVFEHPLVKSNGSFTGGHVDKWTWRLSDDLTESELMKLYNVCKNSWK